MLVFLVTLSDCLTTRGQQYFPLSDGARWEYLVQEVDSTGTVESYRMIRQIAGHVELDGIDYFKLVTSYDGSFGVESKTTYTRKTRNGVYAIGEAHQDEPEYLVVQLPVSVGTSWITTSPTRDAECRVIGKAAVEVMGARYPGSIQVECHVTYKDDDGEYPAEESYCQAPGIGTVRQITRFEDRTVEIQLKGSSF